MGSRPARKDEITLADREFNLTLSRPLHDGELDQVNSIQGVRSIKVLSQPSADPGRKSVEYLIILDLSSDDVDQDLVLSRLLRGVLDMGIAPRKLAEGRSLESQFLEVTGGQADEV